TEAETAMRGFMERWISDANLVTREEFEAVREMAERARAENEALKARLDALDAKKK
ncbi:MAG: accessory factor UbiK family protein, partial [Thermohalobaculum sp.]|nr:accessory factor UbiK family protein [Thermohalobaculum sp.]